MSKLKIELKDNNYILSVQDPARFDHHGFGTFMKEVKKGEVEITKEAFSTLLEEHERDGMQGIEFWPTVDGPSFPMIAWGVPYPVASIPIGEVNLPTKAKIWVRERFQVTG